MKLANRSGTTIAAAVAALLLAGAVVAPVAQAEESMGQCIGGNNRRRFGFRAIPIAFDLSEGCGCEGKR